MQDNFVPEHPSMPAVELRRGRNKGTYLYRQFADSVEEQIRSGHYQPGQKLPSMDQLAANFSINKLTVYKALQELARRGVIRTVRAQGTFVSGGEDDPRVAAPGGVVGTARLNGLSVGVVSRVMPPGNTGYYHLMLVDALRRGLDQFGAGLLLLPTNSLEHEEEIAGLVRESPVGGILCIGELETRTFQALMSDTRKPLVLLDYCEIGLPADTICQNNRNGAYLAVEHLLASGRKRIALVCGPEDQRVSLERREGALHALRQYGFNAPVRLEEGNFSKVSGCRAMERLLASGEPFDAVFFMNDEMALGGLEVARTAGKHVPEDFAVIGYDDIPLAGEQIISLSTVRAPVEQMGRLAVEHLMALRENPAMIKRSQELMPELVARRSTAPVA